MAVTDTGHDVTRITRFYGLSTDTKPTNAMVGATFHETNTRHSFVWTRSAWVASEAVRTEDPNQKAAFGELLVAEPTPVVQIQFPYNINTDLIEKRENASGTITESQSMAVIQSGASANSAGHMLSIVPLCLRRTAPNHPVVYLSPPGSRAL